MRRLAFGLALLVMLSHATADPAPPATPPSPADALLAEGTRLFTEEADYEGARDRFQRAYALSPSWRALNGLALVDQEQGRYVDALDSYQRLLTEFQATLTPEQVATLGRRIAKLEARVARVAIRADQPGVRVTIDGHEIGVAPYQGTVRLLPGRHDVLAMLTGYAPLTETLMLEAGQQRQLTVHLSPSAVAVVYRDTEVHWQRRFGRWLPWATGGLGAVLLGTGGLLSLSARSDFDSFDRAVAAATGAGRMAAAVDDAAKRRGESKQLAGGVLMASGGVVLAGALVLFLVNQPRAVHETPRARAGLGLGSAWLEVVY